MIEAIVAFFSTEPPAMDPTLIPWMTALVAGNIITVTGLWALLKYIAKQTPWATDDKILQIITGGVTAIKGAVIPLVGKKEVPIEKKEEMVEECEHKLDSPDAEVCGKCGQPIE